MRCLALVVVLVAACGEPLDVGSTCSTSSDCDDTLTCNTSVPGGYCTASCTTSGSTTECPFESVCDALSGTALTCVKICETSADCRSDLDCNGVSGSNIKACKPKT
ncbi:MAG TPA: hypothetical protein VL326_02335 [Kofleriaceae bacterium]|jgi:hypothetical protein|nr:hypothetical protein [Kofleriaceae bacterium]